MRYHEDTGTVVKVTEKRATIKLDHPPREECGTCCACSSMVGEHLLEVDRGSLKPGDRVSARIPQVNTYVSVLLVFGLPLALFFLGIYFGRLLEGGEQVGTVSILGGVVGLAVAFGVAWLINRKFYGNVVPEAHKIASEVPSSSPSS